jgi:hypothetical protein
MSYEGDLPPAEDLLYRQPASRRLSDADAERLIVWHWAHPEAGAEQHRLAELFDSVTAPATDEELSGQAAAVAAFAVVVGGRSARSRGGASRRAMGITAGIVALSITAGFSGAAAADVLPGPIQELAHQTLGAPAPGRAAPAVRPAPVSGRPAHPSGAARGKANGHNKGNAHGAGQGQGKGNQGTPPGLAKKGGTPPGLAKKGGTPPGLAKKGATPPGQAKKGGTPPGQAKKAGATSGQAKKETPPGQAKKGVSASLETVAGTLSPLPAKLLPSGLTKRYEPRHASPSSWRLSSRSSGKARP